MITVLLFACFALTLGQDVQRSLHIMTEIHSRFAVTNLGSIVENPSNFVRRTQFICFIPDTAFISNFTMEIGRDLIVGEVKEKGIAEREYEAAVSRGESAGHVFKRDQNLFTIEVSVEPRSQVIFILTYQEVLRRVEGAYKHVLHIPNEDDVQDLQVDVVISEKAKIDFVHVPELAPQLSTMTNKDLRDLPPSLIVEPRIYSESDGSLAYITYVPDPSNPDDDRSADRDMIVLYDLERRTRGGEMEVVDGYFIHSITPPEFISSGDKHVVFVMDKSGSMRGRKFEQLQNAMDVMMHDLSEFDFFNVIMFSSDVVLWKSQSQQATIENVEDAVRFVRNLQAGGGTNIMDSLQKGIELLKDLLQSPPTLGGRRWEPLSSMVIFLTDGLPTVGSIKDPDQIVDQVTTLNDEAFSIHCIAFGKGADYEFTKKIAITNFGLARRVYVASDAEFQIEGFYEEIGNPALVDVQVKYLEGTVDLSSLVGSGQNDLPSGGELVRAGKLSDAAVLNNDAVQGVVKSTAKSRGRNRKRSFRTKRTTNSNGVDCFNPENVQMTQVAFQKATSSGILCPKPGLQFDSIDGGPSPFTRIPYPANTVGGFIERTWAYMTVQKRLDQAKYEAQTTADEQKFTTEALKLSLDYNFVTDLTSMVITQSNGKKVRGEVGNELLDETRRGPLSNKIAGGEFGCRIGLVFIYDDISQCGIIHSVMSSMRRKAQINVALVNIDSRCSGKVVQKFATDPQVVQASNYVNQIYQRCRRLPKTQQGGDWVQDLPELSRMPKKAAGLFVGNRRKFCLSRYAGALRGLKGTKTDVYGALMGWKPSFFDRRRYRTALGAMKTYWQRAFPTTVRQNMIQAFSEECKSK